MESDKRNRFWKCSGTGCQVEVQSASQECLEVTVECPDGDVDSELYLTTIPEIKINGFFSSCLEIHDLAGDFSLEKLHFGIIDENDDFQYMTVKHDWFPGSLMLNFFPQSLDYAVFKKFNDVKTKFVNVKKARLVMKANGSSFKLKILDTKLVLKDMEEDYKFLYSKHEGKLSFDSKIDVIRSYFPWKEKYSIIVDEFKDGRFRLPDSQVFSLNPDGSFPEEISANPYFLRQYHSLELSKLIQMDGKINSRTDWHLNESLNLAMKWIDRDYLSISQEYKYAWYDHAVADRCIVLVDLYTSGWDLLTKKQKILLSGIIISHLQLLASPVFYLRNQNYPFHNHGLFQDLALLVSCTALSFPGSRNLRRLAEKRMMSQIDNLVSIEGVSVENSAGYHRGLVRILSNILGISDSFLEEDNLNRIQSEIVKMKSFISKFFYPDGSQPAYGDTFNSEGENEWNEKKITNIGSNIFPASGYFSHRSNIPGVGCTQINLYNSSLSRIHKHFDNLQITFWASGKEVFFDPGLSGYSQDDPATRDCRKAENHNLFCPVGYECEIPEMGPSIKIAKNMGGTEIIASSNMFQGIKMNRSLIINNKPGVFRIIDWCDKSVEGFFRLNVDEKFPVIGREGYAEINFGQTDIYVSCHTSDGIKICPKITEGVKYFGHSKRRTCAVVEFHAHETPIITTITIGNCKGDEELDDLSKERIRQIVGE